MHTERLKKIRLRMSESGLDHLIISDPVSVYYLTGLTIHPGERMLALLLDMEQALLIVNRLFPVTPPDGLTLAWYSDTEDPVALLSGFLDSRSDSTIGIDKAWPARFLLRLQALRPGVRYCNGSAAVDDVRMIKDAEERQKMREASRLNDKAMEALMARIPEKQSEVQMIASLQQIYGELGSGFSFEPIICYGANCADPHHSCDGSTVKAGDSVILDIGCTHEKYCSDMTRTVFYQEVTPEAETVYKLVLEANLAAIAAVRPGARFRDIDAAARSVIEAAGYGPYFTHRTGHAIGLEVHDAGDVSAVNDASLEPGMIFSIEPGIYLQGRLGVRIEDLVLVTEEGCEVLNKVPKELAVIY